MAATPPSKYQADLRQPHSTTSAYGQLCAPLGPPVAQLLVPTAQQLLPDAVLHALELPAGPGAPQDPLAQGSCSVQMVPSPHTPRTRSWQSLIRPLLNASNAPTQSTLLPFTVAVVLPAAQ